MPALVKNDQLMADLNEVNRHYNKFKYETDLSKHGTVDFWTARIEAYNSGDCDDYVLSKRGDLMARGYDWQCLQPAICKLRGEGHLVLLVKTEKEFLILDNNYDDIKTWPGTGYEWLYRLDGERGWVNFNEQLS